jgi:hypothetical protein
LSPLLELISGNADLSHLASEMEDDIGSARVLLALAHTHAQRAKAKKDLIGSIVHRLIANTSVEHTVDEVFGGQAEAFETFKRVFFEPLTAIGAGSFNLDQLLDAAKELSQVQFGGPVELDDRDDSEQSDHAIPVPDDSAMQITGLQPTQHGDHAMGDE